MGNKQTHQESSSDVHTLGIDESTDVSTEAPKKSTCENIGKTTCSFAIGIMVILLLVVVCWWLFQICSNGNGDDDDQGSLCDMLGNIAKIMDDVTKGVLWVFQNIFWALAIGILFLLVKTFGGPLLEHALKESKDNQAELNETGDKFDDTGKELDTDPNTGKDDETYDHELLGGE